MFPSGGHFIQRATFPAGREQMSQELPLNWRVAPWLPQTRGCSFPPERLTSPWMSFGSREGILF